MSEQHDETRYDVRLDLPYEFTSNTDRALISAFQQSRPDLKPRELYVFACCALTEDLVLGAAEAMYPKMGSGEAGFFAGIMRWLGSARMSLSYGEFMFLYDMFFSPRAIENVRFHPRVAALFLMWRIYLMGRSNEVLAERAKAADDIAVATGNGVSDLAH